MMATAGLVIAGAAMGTWWSLAGMCLATAGFYGTKGPFWAMPTMILTGAAAASGIAFINAFGNIGGAVGPALVGWLKDLTGSYAGGLYGLAAFHRRWCLDRCGGAAYSEPRRSGSGGAGGMKVPDRTADGSYCILGSASSPSTKSIRT